VVAGPAFGSMTTSKLYGKGVNTSQITGDYVRNSHILINLAKAIGQLIVLYKSITQVRIRYTYIYLSIQSFLSLIKTKRNETKSSFFILHSSSFLFVD
jgi:ATP-binding cassette subfamily D (ALD) protein 3